MTVIELCGNPGCGKSTLCNSLIGALRGRGLRVEDYNSLKPCRYTQNLSYLLSFRALATAVSLFCFGKHVPFRRRLLYSVKCAAIPAQVTRWEKESKTDYVVFDEGIVQYISTLSHDIRLSENDFRQLKSIRMLYQSERYVLINCQLTLAENIRRIRGRGRVGDRFVAENDTEQARLLTLKRENLTEILSWLKPVQLFTVDMIGDAEDNLRLLLRVAGIERE